MRNKITTDDLINALEKERQNKIRENVKKEVEKWGGKRLNAGRKPKNGDVLKFSRRLSEKEKDFVDYARSHNINYDDLMQG